MGLFSFILGMTESADKYAKDEKKKKLEQEMDWNNLDEDDYYSEDCN